MKRIALTSFYVTLAALSSAQQPESRATIQTDSFYLLSPVEVRAIRVNERAPFTKTNLSRLQIKKLNLGQDLPYVLNQTPSVVASSDAGNGVGYTYMKIRGTDATRINVTLNGIPFNDAESQGSFFVNLPDFTSSVNSIQIQRGVGTSSNGTGAFGATVSLSTNEVNKEPYAEITNSFGSFSTWRHTVKAGTGLINEHFTLDARLSRITSDGYVDRASSNLQAFSLSGAYLADKSTLRFNIFSGKEKTYQAWNGISKDQLKDNRTFNSSGTDRPGSPYENETDNYNQTHYQLFFDTRINSYWDFSTAAFLTRGLGYYENYKGEEALEDYGLSPFLLNGALIEETDLIRQKWLDNYFFGQIASAQFKKNNNTITVGGGWSRYTGDHIGKVIWAKYGFDSDFEYYNNPANKSDINTYVKWQHALSNSFSFFADVQYRYVQHSMNGFEDNPTLYITRKFNFLNPKAGISYHKNGWQTYLSYAKASKEPNRNDFEAGVTSQPRHEQLHDFEAGLEKRGNKYHVAATLYYMHYIDQLVLTGQINDVGAATRINVPKSYRAGIELQAGYQLAPWININGNIAFSRNKIKAFTEHMDSYDADFEWIGMYQARHRNTTIALSPGIVSGYSINFLPTKNLELSLLGKYVSDQYLDNTQNADRKLNAFYTKDIRAILTFNEKVFKEWNITAQVNNIFNQEYEPNGWTYPYRFNGSVTADNGYYPMAGTNFMLSLNIRL